MSECFPRDPQKDRDMDQAAWTVALRLGKFSYAKLSVEAHIAQYKVEGLIKRWQAAGAVKNIGKGASGRLQFEVTKRVEETPSRQLGTSKPVSPEQAMWIAIRRVGVFTAADIAAYGDEVQPLSLELVRAYIHTLLAAEYLRVVRKSVHGKSPAAYRLIKDTGPLAPTTRRVTITVDVNLNTVVHVPSVTK
jgi:hypothetical protein